MIETIEVSKLFTNGLTEANGFTLRKEINDILDDNSNIDKIVLDFSNISLFATPFFNASIGYFVLILGPEKFNSLFELKNISELGRNTYQHSYNNAIEMHSKNTDANIVGEITKKNIENG